MTKPLEISAEDIVDAMTVLMIYIKDAVGPRADIGTDPTPLHEARTRLAELLEAWHGQAPLARYCRTSRDSPMDRANRDPLFHALVQLMYSAMWSGEGQWTPTEVREAAMVAQILLERERPVRFPIQPPPAAAGDKRE